MTMTVFSPMELVGLAGFTTYICGFASLQFGLLDGNSRLYSLISVSAATMVLLSLMEHFNLASALIQMSWIAIGLSGLAWKTFQIYRTPAVAGADDRQQFATLSRRLSEMRG